MVNFDSKLYESYVIFKLFAIFQKLNFSFMYSKISLVTHRQFSFSEEITFFLIGKYLFITLVKMLMMADAAMWISPLWTRFPRIYHQYYLNMPQYYFLKSFGISFLKVFDQYWHQT